MKLFKTKTDKDIYYYFLKDNEKRFMYRYKFYDSLGKRREKKKSGFKTEKKALRSLLEVKASVLNGQTRHIEHSQMTVKEWLEIWCETKKRSWKVTTFDMVKVTINHVNNAIGNKKLSTLTNSTYEREFINKLLDEGYKPRTVQLYHTIFKSSVNAAVNDDIILRNKFTNIKLVVDDNLDNFLTPDDLVVFLSYSFKFGDITHYTMILTLAYSGMRKGELQGLKWRNIDFDNNTIEIERTRDHKGPRTPKTKRSFRKIEVDEIVTKQLKSYLKWCKELKLSFGMQLDIENDFVFISENNPEGVSHFFINHFMNKLYRFMESEDVFIKRITPHGLRHTHATVLIDELIPPPDIAERLGNSIEMIYNVYAHSFKKIENKTVNVFGDRLKSVIK